MPIPLIDLKRQYAAIQTEAEAAVCSVLASGSYIMGANVQAFEEEFAAYCGVKHAIAVGNGTDALVISLEALGIGPGDEVITAPFTFFATAESISAVGATPVFIDIRPDTYNLDENLIEAAITDKTKAIMPVHIFGQPCEMDKINHIAAKHNLYVIEDACQAVSAEYQGKKTGTLADIACFSFFPTKNLSCAGDGGMITTDNDRLAAICRALRTHGSGEAGQKAYNLLHNIDAGISDKPAGDNTVYNPLKYYNYLIGHNSRLDELQAALLRIKLRKLDEYQKQREDHARYYNEALQESDLQRPAAMDNLKHAWHLYILQSENRPAITEYLNSKGIATGIYYPVPLHLQKAYINLGYRLGDLPVAEYLSQRTFAIPCFPELTAEEREYIIATLTEK
ncbi:DegT/DnrJ/EryC1/StrS family aminotransferase [Syntrophomonas wolfei]|uniref:Pyridoxal phosphate-dependent enzyme n=1 Tax=Syntrophomonas wolfei subsp. wolfei (strain DSM 2245B / Goettingen) TaxID=335541 RepID=Q0AZ27_SYNWW|nr:DegT/DnrJ/EryC1/StrS family aminotransferase [Syntrophomonas wolfei]ABI68027.1 pyridoxal phosphate-dependent enzyme [Syntrophomonas wolfei subsp. wolfei str. Goettingen G311]